MSCADEECSACSEDYCKPIIWVLGGPGSGKGTQCQMMVERYGVCYLSIGDLLRAEVKSGTDRAMELQEVIENGHLVPNEVVLDILLDAINLDAPEATGYLIDGFPREENQGIEFETFIGPVTVILYFHASIETLTQRLITRGLTSGRADDDEETIKTRLKIFLENDEKVVEHFQDKVCKIDAEREQCEVFDDVRKILDPIIQPDNVIAVSF